MENNIAEDYSEFQKYFYASCILALIAFICALIAIGSSGYGNEFINSVVGNGSFEQRTNIGGASSIVSATGAYVYALTATWNDGTPLKFVETVDMNVDTEVKGRFVSNTYRVGIYNDETGYKHRMEARKISGPFTGRADFLSSETSLESILFMEGNASFEGELINTTTGRHPTTESETFAVGYNTIRQAFNANASIVNVDAWLAFCNAWNGLPPSPDTMGLKIIPKGYEMMEDGNFVPEKQYVMEQEAYNEYVKAHPEEFEE